MGDDEFIGVPEETCVVTLVGSLVAILDCFVSVDECIGLLDVTNVVAVVVTVTCLLDDGNWLVDVTGGCVVVYDIGLLEDK